MLRTVQTEPRSLAAPVVEREQVQSGARGENPAETGGEGTQTGDELEKPGVEESNQPPAGLRERERPSPTDPGRKLATDTSPH